MKILDGTMMRTGIAMIALVVATSARADTQNEKGDAGQKKTDAELLDCKIDKWVGSHSSASDGDLIRMYWPGGDFTVEVDPSPTGGALDGGIMVFADDGSLAGTRNAVTGVGKEALTISALPKGIYCVYGGHQDAIALANNGVPIATPSGPAGSVLPFFTHIVQSAPSVEYSISFPGYEHQGIPFQQTCMAGNKRNDMGPGPALKVTTSRKKAVFFLGCANLTDERGATNVKVRGVSKRKFRQKYLDGKTGKNLTAQMLTGVCADFDPDESRTVKCIIKPQAKFRQRQNLRSKCLIVAQHPDRVKTDQQKVKLKINAK